MRQVENDENDRTLWEWFRELTVFRVGVHLRVK